MDQVLQGRTPTADDLPWLTATLKEALRAKEPVTLRLVWRTAASA